MAASLFQQMLEICQHGIMERWKKEEGIIPDFSELASAIPEQYHRILVTWNGRLPDLFRTVTQSSSLQVGSDSPCDLELASDSCVKH